MPDQLTGKAAIVTGGGSGIGREVCLLFAREGADIAVCDVNLEAAKGTAASVEKLGRRAQPIAVDISDTAQVDAMVAQTIAAFGQIDILVNCAGIWLRGPLLDMTEEQWRRTIDVNLTGTFLCTRAVAKHMAPRGQGKIVNIASGRGITGATNGANYAASKAGVIAFTVTAGVELGTHGINVNAVAPGAIDTPFLGAPRDASGRLTPRPDVAANKRVEQPEEVASTVLFLATDASRTYYGQTIFMKMP